MEISLDSLESSIRDQADSLDSSGAEFAGMSLDGTDSPSAATSATPPPSSGSSAPSEKSGEAEAPETGHQEASDQTDEPTETTDPKPAAEKTADTRPEAGSENADDKSANPVDKSAGKKDSKYQAAVKARARQAAEWKEIQATKAELARQRAELEQMRAGTNLPAGQTEERTEYTPEEYEAAADELAKSGDNESAYKALVVARDLRAKQGGVLHQKTWEAGMNQTLERFPELRDGKQPVSVRTLRKIQTNPEYARYHNGFLIAALEAREEEAQAAIKAHADRVSAVKSELDAVRKKLANYEKKSQPLQGNPQSGGLPLKTFDELDPQDQERSILANLREFGSRPLSG